MNIVKTFKRIVIVSSFIFIILTFMLAIGLVSKGEAQQAPITVTHLQSPFGGGGMEGYMILQSLLTREHPWLRIKAQETPGYGYNIREMAKNKSLWKSTTFATEDSIIQLSFSGGSPEIKEFYPEPIKIKWKLLFGTTWAIHGKWFVTFDPKIKTPTDFKGKRIGLGLRTQSDWGADPKIFLEDGYGITSKNADIRHLKTTSAVEALIDGKLDVFAGGAVMDADGEAITPAGAMLLLNAANRKIYYISIDEEAVGKVNKKYGTTYITATVPKGSFKDQENDLLVGAVRVFSAVHSEFPDQYGYEIVKTVIKFRKQLKEGHPFWKTTTFKTMVHGLSEDNVHPGALRAFKEAGLWEMTKKYPAVTYPENK